MTHVPVLVQPVLDLLAPEPGDVVVDATLGRGGHAAAIGPLIAPAGRYVGLDLDPANLEAARESLGESLCGGVTVDLMHRNFADVADVLGELEIAGFDGLLADLGFASTQVDDPERGLSFKADGPLDMRLNPTCGPTAADMVNTLDEKELADVIYRYGEERLSRRIARKVVEARRASPISTTGELAKLCAQAYPHPRNQKGGHRRIDPATRTFQALRIAVNDELGNLERLIEAAPRIARPGARIVIISFHSLEDRMVKRAFRGWAGEGLGTVLTKRVVVADDAEIAMNRRSRSAKARAFRFDGSGNPRTD